MRNHKSAALVAALCGFVSLSTVSIGQPFWSQYGKNAQHTAASTNGVQALNAILWQTPVDLYPVGDTNGEDVLAHYGSPLITLGGTVVVNVRTGPNNNFPSVDDTYRVEGHNLGTGVTTWTENSDFVDWMPHDWTPSYASAIDSLDHLYFPGPGGTLYERSSADAVNATTTQLCFYGMTNFQSTSVGYENNIQICTPLTIDSANNVYFGFYVATGFSNPLGMTSGIAKVSSTGVGTWVAADKASGVVGQAVAYNCAPAVTADGKYVYVAVKSQGGSDNPVLLRLNTSDLSTANSVTLTSPPDSAGNQTFPYILDDGTSSPTIGPDGDVYFGVWWSDLESRGFMLHYSADLSIVKPAGAFGWDDTASIIPASAVPSYTGSSSYLILTKYNNYSDAGLTPFPGNGQNEVAILDPNATEQYTVQYDTGDGTGPTYTTMKEILTVVGPTPNTGQDGVREWCINMAAIDVAGKAAVVNSEDGHCYRWDFTTNQLTQVQDLQPATGEAYTPTVVGPDGISFAINNAVLFAMWDGAKPTSVSVSSNTVTGGSSQKATLQLSAPASGPGATVQLTSNNPSLKVPASVLVPAGQSSVSFTVSAAQMDSSESAAITATRYGYSTTQAVTIGGSGLYAFVLESPTLYGGQTGTGDVALAGPAPSAGRTITLTSSISSITFSPSKFTIAQGSDYAYFKYTASVVANTQVGQVTATLDDGTKLTSTVVNHAALVTASLAVRDIVGGTNDTLNLSTQYAIPAGGLNVSMQYSANTSGPATIHISSDGTTSQAITTKKVANSVSEVIFASYDGNSTVLDIDISPAITLKSFTLSSNTVFETGSVIGTVTTTTPATGSTLLVPSSSSSEVTVTPYGPTVLAGKSSVQVTVAAHMLTSPVAQSATVSIQFDTTTLTQTVQVKPLLVSSLSVSSATVTQGKTIQLTVHMNGEVNSSSFWCKLSTGSALLTGPGGIYFKPYYNNATVTLTAASSVPANTVIPVTVTLRGATTKINVTVEP